MKKIRINSSDILFEDNSYIAINKHKGWYLETNKYDKKDGLKNALSSFIKQRDRLQNKPSLICLYQLDVDSSGVVLFIKSEKIHIKSISIITKNNDEKIDYILDNNKNINLFNKDHISMLSFFDDITKQNIKITANDINDFEDKNNSKKEYYIFNKPYNVLCQFTKQKEEEVALCDFNLPKNIYPAGRLDKDSEGLLLLTNDGDLINKMSHPSFKKKKKYWVQVEREPSLDSLKKLSEGVIIKGGYKTLPAQVKILKDIKIEDRVPPIRERKTVPTAWLEIIISEGKNRQVRSMTASVGHPTLRLLRVAIGEISLPEDLNPGDWKSISSFSI